MYDAFSDQDGVTSISFSKNLVDAMNINLGDDDTGQKVKGDITQIRFMSYNPKKGSLSGPEFIHKAIGYLPKSSYKKYDDKGNPHDVSEIWLLGHGRKYRECHLFINNENPEGLQFVVSFYGDFKVEDINSLKEAGDKVSKD